MVVPACQRVVVISLRYVSGDIESRIFQEMLPPHSNSMLFLYFVTPWCDSCLEVRDSGFCIKFGKCICSDSVDRCLHQHD
jgi:hypothetical protein